MKLQLKFGLFTFKTMSVFLSTIPENNGMTVAFAHNAVQDHDVGKGVCPWVPYRTLEKKIYRVQIPVKKNIQQLSKFGT